MQRGMEHRVKQLQLKMQNFETMIHFINVKPFGYGHWRVEFDYEHLTYTILTDNSELIDKIYDANINDDTNTINEIWQELTEKIQEIL